MRHVTLVLRLVAAGILLQTLYFKFSGAPESKWIFGTLGVEPWGRWFAGLSELVAAVLLLVPSTQAFGGLMAVGVMGGAILSHLFVLGIAVQGDGGLLFALAWVVFACGGTVALLRKQDLLDAVTLVRNRLKGSGSDAR